MKEHSVCFFDHRTICESEGLRKAVRDTIERLIATEGVDTFLFGSRSEFDRMCLELVTELKEKYPHVKRIYVRAEYPVIKRDYEEMLLRRYDETYYPESLLSAGKAVYLERNRCLVQRSRFCIVYYDKSSAPPQSGTKSALDYAMRQGREILLFSREFP